MESYFSTDNSDQKSARGDTINTNLSNDIYKIFLKLCLYYSPGLSNEAKSSIYPDWELSCDPPGKV